MKLDELLLNEKLIISATNYARSVLNIDEGLWVFINDSTHFMSNEHSALYDKENFLIRFNKEWIKSAKDDKIIKTSFHEVFHVLQHASILEWQQGYNNEIFTIEELKIMEYEFSDKNYSTDIGKYENQLIEIQAETFASYLFDRMPYSKIDLISKYLKLYINK